MVRSPEEPCDQGGGADTYQDKYPILGLPILRGAVTFLDSMIRGVKALMFSADYFPDDEAAQPSKLDLWLEKHVPAEKAPKRAGMGVGAAVSGHDAGAVLLPTFVAGLFRAQNAALHNLIEGRHQGGHLSGLSDPLLQAEGCAPGVLLPRCRTQDHFLL